MSKEQVNNIIKNMSKKDKIDLMNDKVYKELEKKRKKFVKKFNKNFILNTMTLKDYVEADRDKNNFCYIVEREFDKWGRITGSTVDKFGVYKKKGEDYKVTKVWNKQGNVKEGFNDIKKAIYDLLDCGKKKNYEGIKNNKISPNFKSKILSLYYPNDYLPIYSEDQIDIFLNFLEIKYNLMEYDTIEKKKLLLMKYKKNIKFLRELSNNSFIKFLYRFVNPVILSTDEESGGDIDYKKIIEIDLEYLNNHHNNRKRIANNTYKRDYELENLNRKIIGKKGEKTILEYEIFKLNSLNKKKLARKVRDVSDNTSLGYDIISYDEKGREIHIEVKTKNSSKEILDFYITSNELDKFVKDKKYRLYYLYDIRSKYPKLHIVDKNRFKKSYLQPVLYRVNVDVKSIKL